ncbi:hypothetical protein CTA1_11635 [Colletotrichum tanaceti]|uniref:Uncharacterized protein n=1 Tax=Colletotrichum tanaceti TaxID=1306861 RepID=A0A4U6XSX8_9PEZI|nr:hypothetical protein CTA1_11635 [Colletotrichum tanaceti]
MAITRIGLIALAGDVKQDEAVARFSNFANECKKTKRLNAWYRDMEYFQTKDVVYKELMKQAAEGKATAFIVVSAEF